MTDRALRIAVLGAGAVGGLVGALLASIGDEVTLLAGGPTAEAVRAGGLTVHSGMLGDVHVVPGVAGELEQTVDACVVAVKAFDLEPALGRIRPDALGTALLVPFLNGVEHVARLRRLHPRTRVVAASIRVESRRTAPGRVEHTSPFVSVEMAVRPEVDADLRRLGAHLERAGIDVHLRDDEAGLLWSKLVFLAPLALLTTHAGAPAGVVRTERRDDLVAAVREAATVAGAEGAAVDAEATIAALDAVPATMRSSMQRDAEEGRPIELDAIGGSILRAGARTGVPTPVTARLVAALRDRHPTPPAGG